MLDYPHMENLESTVRAIEERNARVEADKAWETSYVRRGCIGAITYATAALFLWSIGDSNPLLHGLIPTGGYLLSTVSLPPIRTWWMRQRAKGSA